MELVPAPGVCLPKGDAQMQINEDPLARFGLDAIDLRWTMKDITGKRWHMINQVHFAKLIELGMAEMRDDRPVLAIAGQTQFGKAEPGLIGSARSFVSG